MSEDPNLFATTDTAGFAEDPRVALEPREMNEDPRVETAENIEQFFKWAHLPPNLQDVSRRLGALAGWVIDDLPNNPERAVALRKLLEAKDAAVRASLYREREK